MIQLLPTNTVNVQCADCGTVNDLSKGRFCGQCGTALDAGMNGGNLVTIQEMPIMVEDKRSRTIFPIIAACLAVASGIALAVYALTQLQSSNILIKGLGIWNGFVSLAFFWLAFELARRSERAYVAGLLLSIGNLVFIILQFSFWNTVGMASGYSESERAEMLGASSPLLFLLADMLLAAAVFSSFRDLVHPVLPEEIPDSELLQARLSEAGDEKRYTDPVNKFLSGSSNSAKTQTALQIAPPTAQEMQALQDLRRNFLAYMKSNARGGAELNVMYRDEMIDLVVIPLWSYFMANSEEKHHKRYLFYPMITSLAQLERLRKSAQYIIAISAMPDVAKQTGRGKGSTGLYLIRDGLWVSGGSFRSRAFEKIAERDFGLKFKTFGEIPPEEAHGLPRYG